MITVFMEVGVVARVFSTNLAVEAEVEVEVEAEVAKPELVGPVMVKGLAVGLVWVVVVAVGAQVEVVVVVLMEDMGKEAVSAQVLDLVGEMELRALAEGEEEAEAVGEVVEWKALVEGLVMVVDLEQVLL